MMKPIKMMKATRPGIKSIVTRGAARNPPPCRGPERNQAELDLAAGQPAGQRTAKANAERDRADDDAGAQFVPARVLAFAVHVNGRPHKGDDEREKGDADHREYQGLGAKECPQAVEKRLEKIGRKLSVGLAAGMRRMSMLATAPIAASTIKTMPIMYSCAQKQERQDAAGHRAENHGQKRQRFEHAVAFRQQDAAAGSPAWRQYLAGTKNAECMPIRKTVERTVHEPNCGWPCVPSQKPRKARAVTAISANFQNTSEVALAVAVGEVAGERAEDGPGGIEEDRHQRNRRRLGEGLRVDGEEHRRGVNGLIVECGQELGDQQADVRAIGKRIRGQVVRPRRVLNSLSIGIAPLGRWVEK